MASMQRPSERTPTPAIALIGVIAAALIAHAMLLPKIASLDSFYHMGHAARYATHGAFDTSFPWARFSAVGDLGADLWWGFHVLLMPFAALGDPAIGIRLAGVVLTVTLLAGVLAVGVRHGFRAAWLWPLLFFAAVPNVMYRFVMVRPHVVSTLASILLLSFLVRGRARQVALAAAVVTFAHLSLFWMPLLLGATWLAALAFDRWVVGGATSGARRSPGLEDAPPYPDALPAPRSTRVGRRLPVELGALIGGALIGWLARPRPFAAAHLVDIQIFELFREKAKDLPITFGGELAPLPFAELLRTSWFFILLWVGVLGLVVWTVARRRARLRSIPAPERHLLWASGVLSVGFLGLTLLVARRAQVEWVVFGSLVVPVAATYLLPRGALRPAAAALAVALAVHLPWAVHRHRLNVAYVAYRPDLLAGASEWLAGHSRPGDLVFHLHWDEFGPLFARNRTNTYLGGMDPIFLYAHDRGRFWEYFYLSTDATDYTCDAFPCREGVATDTYEVVRSHFGARWVLVEPRRNPRLARYFMDDPRFAPVFESGGARVYEVLESGARGADGASAALDAPAP